MIFNFLKIYYPPNIFYRIQIANSTKSSEENWQVAPSVLQLGNFFIWHLFLFLQHNHKYRTTEVDTVIGHMYMYEYIVHPLFKLKKIESRIINSKTTLYSPLTTKPFHYRYQTLSILRERLTAPEKRLRSHWTEKI